MIRAIPRLSSFTSASVVTKLGSPLEYYDNTWPIATPGKNEVKVKVAAIGCNFAEVLQAKGLYQEKLTPPFVPGNEVSGEICELGPNSSGFKIGDRVICLARGSGYANEVLADYRTCIKIPESAKHKDLSEAAALLVQYGTAHLALIKNGRMVKGDHVLITAAAGGVGLAACELAGIMGAGSIIAAVGNEEKLNIAKSKGATCGLIYTGLDSKQIREQIKVNAPKGVDIVVDMVGANVLEPCIRSLNWNGRGVVIGFAGGDIPKIPANLLLVKNISISGLFWGQHMLKEPKTLLDSANQLVKWWAEGEITPHVCERVPLKEANKAFDLLEGRRSTGKVVLIP